MQLLAPIRLLAETEGAATTESEGINLLLPPTSELIAGLIAFAIIFAFAWKWVLPAVNRTLEARQQAITGQLTAAEDAKREAEGLLADYRAQLAKARDEANRIVEEARATGESLRSDIVGKAQTEAETVARRAREEAVAERERAATAIRNEVATLSLDLAQKVVAGSIDSKAQKALVDRYIADLETLEG
ncbi:MAG TPA: F0F1 ATP synthase subunit B [Acidimicrobiia bacterium]